MIQEAYKNGYRRAVREFKAWLEREQEFYSEDQLHMLRQQLFEMEESLQFIELESIMG